MVRFFRIRSLLRNLQIKVLLLFLLVALVPLGIVAAFSIRTAEELIITMASNQLGNVANDKVAILERWIQERKADLNVVAGSSILQSMDAKRIAPYLNLVGTHYKVYKGFLVVSSEGTMVFNSFDKQLNYAWKEGYQQPLSDKLYISAITLEPERKKSFFQIFAPIFSNNGSVKGAVCAAVDTHTILSIILKVSLGETGECYLVNKQGTFLAHKEPKRILTENIAQSESFKNIFGKGYKKSIYTDYRGIEVLGTSRQIADTDWYLVVEQDRDEAFLSADKLKKYIYLVIIFSLCAAVFLAWLVSYYVVHPIRKLSEATNILAKGEFRNSMVITKRTDEIGVLYNAFEDMARRLQARERQLVEKVGITEAELKETDVRLKKTQLAAARSEQLAALGRLAAGVTHEIRTPLTSLKLFLESAQGEIEISPEYQEDFHIAMGQIKRIEATVNRFLEFAKPQEPLFSTVDVRQLIEEALLVVRPRANQQETIVDISIKEDVPTIRGDKKQLGEALLNVLVNALEAMAKKGKLMITVSSGHYKIDNEPCKCARIDISDTGPGIAAENIPKLFDPFFTTKASGTGLGLSIAYSTVRRHGGEVRVKRKNEEGITFSILIPALINRESR